MTTLSRLAWDEERGASRKRRDFAAIGRGLPLARKRLAGLRLPALVLFLLAQGCLVPQSVDEINTRPHSVPRVDLTKLPNYMLQPSLTLDPQEQGDLTSNPPCHCELDVSVPAVIADDPTVDIDVRVFVDYDVNVPRSQPPSFTVKLNGSFEQTDPTRKLELPPFDASRLGGPGLHVVELVLGERAGFADDTVFPPHRAMLATFESSTFKFVVQVLAPDPARQSCGDPPQLPPQTKKCP
jgi:hypothetical protein